MVKRYEEIIEDRLDSGQFKYDRGVIYCFEIGCPCFDLILFDRATESYFTNKNPLSIFDFTINTQVKLAIDNLINEQELAAF